MIMKKNIIPILGLLLICISSLSAQFSGGSGTETDPYQIATPTDLDNVRSYYTSHFVQTADIDLDVAPYNLYLGWNPISFEQTTPFRGTFDGNGYTIYHLFINHPGLSRAGLFGYVSGANLQNIVLEDVDITCNSTSGALLGVCSHTDVTDCFASGEITGNGQDIGGMFGSVKLSSNISHCVTDMAVSGGQYSSGLVAWVEHQCAISDCGALGTVNGLDRCGGLVGDLIFSTLSRSYAICGITGEAFIGGLVGTCQKSSSITDCFSRCQIRASDSAGGISGSTFQACSISNCYSASSFSNGNNSGGITGGATSSPIVACYWNTDLSGPTSNSYGEGRTTVEMTFPFAANTYVGWDFIDTWHSDSTGNQNSGYPYLGTIPTAIADPALLPLPVRVSVYPNPFREQTVLLCKTDQPGMIFLSIYNLKGQRIRQLTPGFASAGEYRTSWDGKDDAGMDSASGIYLLRLTQGDKSFSHRVMRIR